MPLLQLGLSAPKSQGMVRKGARLLPSGGPGVTAVIPFPIPPHPAASPKPILGKGIWMALLLHTSSSQSPPESG